MKYLMILLVVLLTLYAPLELTRLLIMYKQGWPMSFYVNSMELELFIIWFSYICAVLVLNWRLK